MSYIETLFYQDPVPVIEFMNNNNIVFSAFFLSDDMSKVVTSQPGSLLLAQYLSNRQQKYCQSWVQMIPYNPANMNLLPTLEPYGEVEETYMGFNNMLVIRTLSGCMQ